MFTDCCADTREERTPSCEIQNWDRKLVLKRKKSKTNKTENTPNLGGHHQLLADTRDWLRKLDGLKHNNKDFAMTTSQDDFFLYKSRSLKHRLCILSSIIPFTILFFSHASAFFLSFRDSSRLTFHSWIPLNLTLASTQIDWVCSAPEQTQQKHWWRCLKEETETDTLCITKFHVHMEIQHSYYYPHCE